MIRRTPAPRQHDTDFARRVGALLRDDDQPASPTRRITDAIVCAALSVLAGPAVSRQLLERTEHLLATTVGDAWPDLRTDLEKARTLCYDEAGRETHLTVAEAARRLAVHRATIYRWLGDPSKFFSQEHDAPELIPDRISVQTFQQLQMQRAELDERDIRQRALLEDLPSYVEHQRTEYLRELLGLDELTVGTITRFAESHGLSLPPSSVRRWESNGTAKRHRGRPAKTFSAEVAAQHLASIRERHYRREIEHAQELATLRRLHREARARTGGRAGDALAE